MTTIFNLFSDSSEARSYSDGETIYQIGDTADEMYVVLHGSIDVMVNDETFESIVPGSIVGEAALLDGGIHAANAIARGDCRVEPLDRKRFEFLVQQTPYFAMNIMQAMAERMHKKLER